MSDFSAKMHQILPLPKNATPRGGFTEEGETLLPLKFFWSICHLLFCLYRVDAPAQFYGIYASDVIDLQSVSHCVVLFNRIHIQFNLTAAATGSCGSAGCN